MSGERVLPDYSSSSGSDVESTRKSDEERNAESSLHHATTRNLPGTSNEAGTSAPKRQRLQEYSSEDENTYSENESESEEDAGSDAIFDFQPVGSATSSESDEESSSSDFSDSNCVPDPSSDSELDAESATPTDSDGSITQGTVRQSCVGRRSRGGGRVGRRSSGRGRAVRRSSGRAGVGRRSMVRGRGQRGNHRGRRSRVISIPTGAKDISQKDDTYVRPISNFFLPSS